MVTMSSSTDPVTDFARAVSLGLGDTPRWIPCPFLYDERGSELFQRICEQPEYYLTRTEAAILAANAQAIRELTGPVTLIELGSGSAVKTDIILSVYAHDGTGVRYLPVDVSLASTRQAAERIKKKHPSVRVRPVIGRYESAFPLLRKHTPCMLMFLGSSIGNLNQTESRLFWRAVSRHLAPGDYVLLGVDLVKDEALLNAAYNDAAGVTAQFTQNLFHRMNRELGAELDVDQIDHVAAYNRAWQWIEIWGRFRTRQLLTIAPLGERFVIQAGEQILVEISRKFVLENLKRYLPRFGFEAARLFTDPQNWFAVILLRKVDAATVNV